MSMIHLDVAFLMIIPHFSICCSRQSRWQPHSPGGHSFLKFRSFFFLIFPQTFLIFFLILSLRAGYSPGGALPYVGRYHLSVNRPPFLTQILHPMTPFFQTNFNVKFQNFRARSKIWSIFS